jgi:hypothetical protein
LIERLSKFSRAAKGPAVAPARLPFLGFGGRWKDPLDCICELKYDCDMQSASNIHAISIVLA